MSSIDNPHRGDHLISTGQGTSNPGRLNELRRSASFEKAARIESARIEAERVAALEVIGEHGNHQLSLSIKREQIRQDYINGKISEMVEGDKVTLLHNGGLKYPDYYDRGEQMAASTWSDVKLEEEGFQLGLINSSRNFLRACQEYHKVRNPLRDSTSQASQDNLGRFPISEERLKEVMKASAKNFLFAELRSIPDTALMLRSTAFASATYEWIKDPLHLEPWPDNAPLTFLNDATTRVEQATQDLRHRQILGARGEQPYSDDPSETSALLRRR
jgi:hypothetical protein